MAFGLGVLRHAPRDFWAMTPREFQHALDGVYGLRGNAPTQDWLADIMRAFPDEGEEISP